MSEDDNHDPIPLIEDRLVALRQQQDYHAEKARETGLEIRRHEQALALLSGVDPVGFVNRRSVTAGRAIVAALATFRAPVRTEDLLDHEALVHYSRHTLRGAVSELRKAGEITGTRGPKGYIWDPPGDR
jgi:hypothetical protein